MNTEDFVTYEQALALKKLGFREDSFYHYDLIDKQLKPNKCYSDGICLLGDFLGNHEYSANEVSAPTLAQAQKWLRKEKKYSVEAFFERIKDSKEQWSYFRSNTLDSSQDDQSIGYFNSYEEALSAGITECIKILEKECQN